MYNRTANYLTYSTKNHWFALEHGKYWAQENTVDVRFNKIVVISSINLSKIDNNE